MSKSKINSNEMYYDGKDWRYTDTNKLESDRPCRCCDKARTKEGHDGCLGELKGLSNACCGHGIIDDAYVQFLDGTIIKGEDAVVIQNILKK